MNFNELITTVAEMNELSKSEAKDIITDIFDTIAGTMEDEGEVAITGFGKFSVAHRKARKGRNPATGESIKIKASKGPKFKPSSVLKKLIKEA